MIWGSRSRGPQGQRRVAGATGPLVKGVVVWSTQGTCPNVSGTELVYAGGLVEAVTITEEEQPTTSACLRYQSGVYGVEYQPHSGPLSAIHEHNARCAICYASTRMAVTMIPAKTHCQSTWTLEYSGYLMSAASHFWSPQLHQSKFSVAVLTYFEYNVKMMSLLFLLIKFRSQCNISHVCMCSIVV